MEKNSKQLTYINHYAILWHFVFFYTQPLPRRYWTIQRKALETSIIWASWSRDLPGNWKQQQSTIQETAPESLSNESLRSSRRPAAHREYREAWFFECFFSKRFLDGAVDWEDEPTTQWQLVFDNHSDHTLHVLEVYRMDISNGYHTRMILYDSRNV